MTTKIMPGNNVDLWTESPSCHCTVGPAAVDGQRKRKRGGGQQVEGMGVKKERKKEERQAHFYFRRGGRQE
jgi:hypothetical protein